eukprot:4430144-Prymnesium_polylepis.3
MPTKSLRQPMTMKAKLFGPREALAFMGHPDLSVVCSPCGRSKQAGGRIDRRLPAAMCARV